jgi:hypothetical protein
MQRPLIMSELRVRILFTINSRVLLINVLSVRFSYGLISNRI